MKRHKPLPLQRTSSSSSSRIWSTRGASAAVLGPSLSQLCAQVPPLPGLCRGRACMQLQAPPLLHPVSPKPHSRGKVHVLPV